MTAEQEFDGSQRLGKRKELFGQTTDCKDDRGGVFSILLRDEVTTREDLQTREKVSRHYMICISWKKIYLFVLVHSNFYC